MRNLKKLFAVVMVVAMLASIMVPALAADSFKYEADAKKLYDLGLFNGISSTSYVPDLGTNLIRETGLALMIRAAGLQDEVEALSAEEVATQLAKIVDAKELADWAKPYAAYAVKNGLTNGIDASILPNVKFGAKLPLSGKEFVNFVLKAMGYQVSWDDVLTKSAEVGMLTAGEAVTFGTTAELNRDSAVGVLAGAMTGTTASGVTLAKALVDAGAVSADAMATAGYYTAAPTATPAPVALTATASTVNNIQIIVDYSEKVEKDSAEKVDNYKLSKGAIEKAELQDDGSTVILTLKFADAKAQEDKVNLTIKSVKSAAGVQIAETTLKDVQFLDKDIPTVESATVVGKDTIKVIFSEPMKGTEVVNGDDKTYFLSKDGFVVNGGKLYVKEAKLQKNYTEALVKLYSTLPEGDVTIQVKSTSEDFAGFGVIGKLLTVNVVKDAEAPVVVGYEKAKPTEVTLIWNEDIEFDTKTLKEWYHTNGSNLVSDVTIDGNKTTLKFNKEDEKMLPNGTAYVYVLKEAVKDLWGNKNAQQMVSVDVTVDTTAPEVSKVEQGDDEKTVVVTYNEAMDSDSTKKAANYKVLDKDGKEQKDLVKSVSLDKDAKKATLTLAKKIGGDYSLVVEKVKDLAGNEIASVTVAFTVIDKTVPAVADFKATVYNKGAKDQMLKVTFGEAMTIEGKYAINDVENYFFGSKAMKDIKNVKITVVDSGKAVEILVPSLADDKDKGFNIVAGSALKVARVADAAGNYTAELSFDLTIVDSAASPITLKAEATARDTIKVTFDDEVKFEVADFTVSDGVYNLDLAGVETTLNDKGKTVATFTLAKKLAPTFVTGNAIVKIDATPETENKYGVVIAIADVSVADKIAPALYDDGDSETKKDYIAVGAASSFELTVKFSENLKALNGNLALAGNDFVLTLDGTKLVNAKDYVIKSITANAITFTLTGKDHKENDVVVGQKLSGDLDIALAEKVNYVTDMNGNALGSFDAFEVEIDFTNVP